MSYVTKISRRLKWKFLAETLKISSKRFETILVCIHTEGSFDTHLVKKGKHKNGTQFKQKHFSLTLTFKHTFFYSYITQYYPLQLFSAVKNKISRKRKAAEALKANYRGYRGLFRSKNRTSYISETDEFI